MAKRKLSRTRRLIYGLRAWVLEANEALHTREFWIYLATIIVMVAMVAAIFRLAIGFDPHSEKMGRVLACNAGEARMATIIVGGITLVLASVFTLGEIINWAEKSRTFRTKGREHYTINYWPPIIFSVFTVILGVIGYSLLLYWCS